ncbi:two-component system response regulator RppA [Spirulina sp. CCNP1310]|uniref:two-component system response regulator RppA n=1 Tax=Spirulina sp. CCNP1310 TaxID=3110249 RepID=UPI002B21276C|nr:two-component system response regulator RppA [Spirulina sp. CCNP1310]MEA5417584.1 two-component system response regulator RppA [Spirulina sp. CCNP1310]
MRILLVDDEVELTTPLSRVLRQEGYGVDVAHQGAAGLALAQRGDYQLLILDWMLPAPSGLEICRELRSQGDQTPVLFLTAKDTLDDRVLGLDAGADDYLVKPFELRELLARVRALLRRFPLQPSPRLTWGDLAFDPDNRLAYRGDCPIELSEKEAQLLAYFLQHPGQTLTHQQLQEHLWGRESPPNSNVLAALVRLLRRKIEQGDGANLIHTVYGKGYRFGEGL